MREIPKKISISNNIFEFKPLGRGRFKEEFNYIVYLNGEMLCVMKVFSGRGYYKPWIELFRFTSLWRKLKGDEELLINFLKLFSSILEPGESLFIEYFHDKELTKELETSLYLEDTFLGRVLNKAGFNKFRDWYIPEGLREGGQKIEAWK